MIQKVVLSDPWTLQDVQRGLADWRHGLGQIMPSSVKFLSGTWKADESRRVLGINFRKGVAHSSRIPFSLATKASGFVDCLHGLHHVWSTCLFELLVRCQEFMYLYSFSVIPIKLDSHVVWEHYVRQHRMDTEVSSLALSFTSSM